jgi:transposase
MRGQITLNEKEQKRLMILNKVSRGELSAAAASDLLGRSVRQTRRLLSRYRKKGAAGLIHGNRQRRPVNALDPRVGRQILKLAKTTYQGVNQQHFSELLAERENIAVSRSAVRRLLENAGIGSPRPQRRRERRSRRERYSQEGMLVQIDASSHAWFGNKFEKAALFAAIDDATGKVLGANFGQREDAQGYFLLLADIVKRLGRPMALYRDCHGIFQVNMARKQPLDEQLEGKPDLSQFGRLLKEINIESKPAGSPQAKGRIERLFGTFQDRLVAELRLDSIHTSEAANRWLPEFLKRYNRRFAVPPRIAGTVYRPLMCDPSTVFCFKYQRTVGADNTVRFFHHRLQIQPDRTRISYAKARVEVHECLDGSLAVYYHHRRLLTTEAPGEAPVLRARRNKRGKQTEQSTGPTKPVEVKLTPPGKPKTSPKTHPWRRSFKTMTPRSARRLPFPVAADVLRRSQN